VNIDVNETKMDEMKSDMKKECWVMSRELWRLAGNLL